jgi:transcriptional regulator GlxA family with amidase domain
VDAEETVTVEEIAQEAGCSVRALQLAFRPFRDITPTETLRRIRLEQARDEILRWNESSSVIELPRSSGSPARPVR